jgi:methionyl-tRNA synthetase
MPASVRTLVTSALPYANGPIHIGHLAGAYLPSDLFVRYKRLQGEDIIHICGSDEMGVAIMVRARKEGITPRELVDRFHPVIVDGFRRFGISFDFYGRTTSDVHRQTSQAFFNVLAEKGSFVTRTEKQPFDPTEGMFLADRFVTGTCPNCGNEDAHGDQCERCGTSLSPSELLNPRSTLSDAPLEWRDTIHWYLPLGQMQDEVEGWIKTKTGWKSNVLGQVGSWMKEGLRDRAITRDVPWGVPVPAEAAAKAGVDAMGKVIYVWFDAPIGYISATKEWAAALGQPDLWQEYWQNSDTRLVHFIGKDNIVFHCIMFPAMLMAHGDYVLPADVPANEFLNIEGQKLSTSRGWAVWLHEYLEELPPDLLRYALAATLPETKDADFSWADFQARVNNELADVLGNLVNRTMTFATRYFDGVVPALENPSEADLDVLRAIAETPAAIGAAYEGFRNRDAVFQTIGLARVGNKYFNDTEPWKSRTEDREKCANTIHVSLQLLASLSILMDPVLPFSARKLRAMLRMPEVVDSSVRPSGAGGLGWEDAGKSLLAPGHALGTPEILFEKIDDSVIEQQVARLGRPNSESAKTEDESIPGSTYEPAKDEITFDDFSKLDLRMGTVVVADRIPKADKLLRLEVDLGYETRQVLSGIAEQYDPADLVGRRVVVVVNLKPRKIRGMESRGMVLLAENMDGKLHFVSSEGDDGAVVR